MAPPITVESPEHLQSLLNQDLTRLSILNFRVDWAQECKQMDEASRELAKKHPKALFLEIEAEALPEISESFEVESVPYFVLLRGHTLLDQIVGAEAVKLSQAIEKHIAIKPVVPLSHTNEKPEAPPKTVPSTAQPNGHVEDNEPKEKLDERCEEIMNRSDVVLFMKGDPDGPRCGFSKQTVKILQDHNINFTSFDILGDEAVRQRLKVLNDWPTYPQLIVKGEFVGGLDIIKEMSANGELDQLLSS